MTVEQALLAALAPGPAPDLPVTDVERLLPLIDRHRLAPLLYHKLPHDTPMAQLLAEPAAHATGRNLALNAALAGIVDAFAEHSLPMIPFKGPLLAEKLHGNPAARACYDIDILIPETDVRTASHILSGLGYQPEDIPVAGHEERWRRYRYEQAFAHRRDGQRVELHWRLAPAFFPLDLTVAQLIHKAETRTWDKRTILELPNEYLLLLLCIHGARHCWSELPWVADIAALLNQVDWSVCLDAARKLRAERMLLLGVALASEIPGVEFPQPLGDIPAEVDALRHAVVARWWTTQELPPTNREYRFFAACREHAGDRARMWWRLLFQPTQADFKWINLPPAFEWAYPLARLLRLIFERT